MIDENEEPTEELIEVIPEPEHSENEEAKKSVVLMTSCVIDYASYNCAVSRVDFKPTLMYAQRTYKFTIKNTSQINLQYNFKIANSMTGILDAGPYSIMPKKGSIAPGCDDNFIIKFNPLEVLKLIESERVTALSGTPAHIIGLLHHPDFAKYDTSSVKSCGVGGARSSPELIASPIDPGTAEESPAPVTPLGVPTA